MGNKEKGKREKKKKRNLGISPISRQKQGELQSMQRETYEATVIEIKRAIFLGKRFFQRTLFFPSILPQLRGNKFQDERSRFLPRGVARKKFRVYLTFIVTHRKNEGRELFHS